MRVISFASAITLGLAALLTGSSALAQDPPDTAPSTTPAKPKPKKVAKGKKKKPAPAPPKDDTATATPAPAPAPAPAPVTQPAPAPMQADPAATAPTSQTSTTSATITSPADKDRVQKKDDEPLTGLQAAGEIGLGTNGMGFGVGARIGYTLPMKLYVGGQFMYQFGAGNDYVSSSAFYPSGEVGYDFQPVKNLVVRPYGGFGMMFVSVSDTGYLGDSGTTVHGHSVILYPGCTVTYQIPKSPVFVGGDARLLIAPQLDSATSFGIFATVGARF